MAIVNARCGLSHNVESPRVPSSHSSGMPFGWGYKHVRNVGPSIGKRHPDEREAFLGHAVRGTSRFYEGGVDETYLVELVNLIGAEYFHGETVKTKGKKRAR